MTRLDATTALRAQARIRRARVLGYSPAVSRVDAAKLQKTRIQQYRSRLQSTVSAQRYTCLADGLPISLAKPALWEVDPCALAEAGLDPEMAKISGPNMRRLLQPLSAQLFSLNESTNIMQFNYKGKTISEFVHLTVPSTDVSLQPSHCLGVFSQEVPLNGEKRKITLFPIHAMVLAANCCRAPKLPVPPSYPKSGSSNETIVPLVAFGVPSAETFILILRFLYLKEYQSTFFPPCFVQSGVAPSTPDENATHLLAKQLESASDEILRDCLKRVHGLWLNGCALGIVDALFWRWLNLAWEVYRDALEAKHSRSLKERK